MPNMLMSGWSKPRLGIAPLMESNFRDSFVRLSSRKRSCPGVWLGRQIMLNPLPPPGTWEICQRAERVGGRGGEVDGVCERRQRSKDKIVVEFGHVGAPVSEVDGTGLGEGPNVLAEFHDAASRLPVAASISSPLT